MNSLLMWIAGIFAAVLAALFAVPYFVDWNSYRGVFEEEASRILGRDVRVGGAVNLRLLPTPYLRFEKLKVADTRPGSGEPLFRAENFTLWLSVPPLLQGNLEVRHIALEKPVVNLALDQQGNGNWTTLGIRPGTLPFVPQKVALQSVEIADGTLVLEHARAGEIGRIAGIAGEISAESLSGPFKFSGDVTVGGASREIRVATAAIDQDGVLRFKATARGKGEGGATLQLDGALSELSRSGRVEGTVTAQIPLPELPAVPLPPGAVAPNDKLPSRVVSLDAKGRLNANADRVEIADIAASIENVGQPQLINGSLLWQWGVTRRFDFGFASRWLDLDRLAGAAARASPVATSVTLIDALTHAMPPGVVTRGALSVDQMTLGGDSLAKLDLIVSREEGEALRIERLLAALPAGGRLALDGLLSRDTAARFKGTVTAAGPSLKRVVDWARAGEALRLPAPESAFSIDAAVEAGGGALQLKNLRGRLSDHPFSANLTLAPSGGIDVDIKADTIESGWLWNGNLSRANLLVWLDRLAAGGEGKKADALASGAAAGTGDGRLGVRLEAGVLRGPDRALRDVTVAIDMAGDRLDIADLRFRSGNTLDVVLSGAMKRQPGGGFSSGDLKATLSAGDAEAFSTFAALSGLDGVSRTADVARLAPLRLAGDVAFGRRTPNAIDVSGDGRMAGGRVTLRARIDGGLANWRDNAADVTLTGEEVNTAELMALVLGHAGGRASSSRASIAIKAVGVPADGMVTDAALTRAGLSLAYNGRTTLDAAARPALTGTLDVAADNLGDVLALAGQANPQAGFNHPVTGTLGLDYQNDGRMKLTPGGLTIAGSEVSGRLDATAIADGRLRIGGEIAVDQATAPGLIASLTSGAPQPSPASAADIAFQRVAGLWSDQPFAGAVFDRFEGEVTLKVARLTLAPGLGVSDAALQLAFEPDRIGAVLQDAALLGGKVKSRVTIEKAQAGVRFGGEVDAAAVDLAALARAIGSPRQVGGGVTASLAVTGQALSPRSLVTSLKGGGKLVFKDAWVDGMSPKSVADTASAGFDKEFEITAATLEHEIRQRLGAGRLTIGSRDVPLDVADGALRVSRFQAAAERGTTEVLATVDLSTFQAETEWRMIALPDAPAKPAWPTVSLYYTGPLGNLAQIEPRLALGSFERELTVRRMEREVEELERLRRLDEERARQERERQKALAEEARRERERQRAQAEAERQERERQRLLELEQRRQRSPDQQSQNPVAPPAAGGATTPQGGSDVASPQFSGVTDGAATAAPASSDAQSQPPSSAAEVEPAAAPTAQAGPSANERPVAPRPRRVTRPRPASAADTTLRALTP